MELVLQSTDFENPGKVSTEFQRGTKNINIMEDCLAFEGDFDANPDFVILNALTASVSPLSNPDRCCLVLPGHMAKHQFEMKCSQDIRQSTNLKSPKYLKKRWQIAFHILVIMKSQQH